MLAGLIAEKKRLEETAERIRLERETGLQEKDNGFTVGFDRNLNPGGALGNIVNPLTGQPIRGGLMYAGVNGANEYQGDPPGMKFSRARRYASASPAPPFVLPPASRRSIAPTISAFAAPDVGGSASPDAPA